MSTVLTRGVVPEVEPSLQRLQDALDRAEAVLTVPTRTPPRQGLASETTRPAVDLGIWTQHVRYARRRDEGARDELVEHYRPHAEALARSLYRHGEPIEDLTQIAFEALLMALQRFDPERRRPFLAYAKPTITGVIQRYFRDLGWSVRIPRWVHERAGPIRDVRDQLTQDLGREPTHGEIADYIGIHEDELRQVLAAEEVRQPGSLDVIDPVTKLQTEQVVGGPDPGLDWAENRTALRQAMELLPAEDRELIQRYFLEEETQAQIAEDLGCSQMQVSRLLSSAIRRLRHRIVGT